jgi:hypothetical protein
MSKQTAVEWLVNELEKKKFITKSEIHIAEKMYEQHIIDAYEKGFYSPEFRISRKNESKQYYNETFNK